MALYLLICLSTNQVRGDDAQEASNEEEEEVGPCGPVPSSYPLKESHQLIFSFMNIYLYVFEFPIKNMIIFLKSMIQDHGQMMAVLKPMSHIVVCAVNQIMDYGVLLRDLQGVFIIHITIYILSSCLTMYKRDTCCLASI